MEKKGFKSLVFCISVLLCLFSLPLLTFAVDTCYIPSLGSCQELSADLTAEDCTQVNSGDLYLGQSASQVIACQLAGCCCFSESGTNRSLPIASASACFQFVSTAQFVSVENGLGIDAARVISTCSNLCSQVGSLDSVVVGSNSTTTFLNLSNESSGGVGNLDDQTQVEIQTLNDCHSVISGQVVSDGDIPAGLLVFTKNSRSTSWGIVRANGDFLIDGVCAGQNKVQAADLQNRYSSDQKIIENVPQDQSVNDVVLTLNPTSVGVISGTIINADSSSDAPVFEAYVNVKGLPYSARTNGRGEFSITIPNIGTDEDKPFTLIASHDSYISNSKVVIVPQSTKTISTQIKLTPQNCFGDTAPKDLTSIHVKGRPDVTLSWNLGACEEQVNSYAIYRCDGKDSACTSPSSYLQIDYSAAKSYTDTTLEWDKNYTYKIGAVYAEQIIQLSSDKEEVNSGNVACEGVTTTTKFCGVETKSNGAINDAAQYCTAENLFKISESCDATKPICVIKSSDISTKTAQCVATNPCAQSTTTNPFGLYSDASKCAAQQNGNICYLDKSTSNVDACLNCKKGMTCSDYRTASACGADSGSCNIGGCAWESIDSIFGIGVCKSIKAASCSDCMNTSRSPFGVCDAKTCDAYGTDKDGCFFKSNEGVATSCQACSATQCGEYKSAETCQGTPSSSTELNLATNEFTFKSNDACNIDVCRWNVDLDEPAGGLCVKDADADLFDDCANSFMDNKKCNLDRNAPTTFVVMPSVTNPFINNISIRFIAQDKGSTEVPQVYSTHFCITDNNDTGCKDTTRDFVVVQRSGAVGLYVNITNGVVTIPEDVVNGVPAYTYSIYRPASGSDYVKNYYVRYFSVDHAKNKEIVLTKTLIVDTTPPKITLAVRQSVPAGQVLKTDIVATVDSQTPVKCIIEIDDVGKLSDTDSAFGSSSPKAYSLVTQKVFQKSDGAYSIKATCRDPTGNAVHKMADIVTNADPRIQNIKPTGIIGFTNPNVTLQTTSPVLCKMTSDQSKLNSNTVQDGLIAFNSFEHTLISSGVKTGNFYNHSVRLSGLTQGTHKYYIACNFTSLSYDSTSFAVDTQPPVVRFENALPGSAFDFSSWHSDLVLYAACYKETNFQDPCDEIEYCTAPAKFDGSPVTACNFLPQTLKITDGTNRKQITTTDDDYSMVVCARAKETVGATSRSGETVCEKILVDRVDPILSLSTLPSVTRSSSVSLNGTVFDPILYQETISFRTSPGVSTGSLLGDKVVARNLFVNGSFKLTSTTTQKSYAQIILRNNTASQVTVQIDMRDVSTAPVASVLGANQQVLASVNLPAMKSNVATSWSILLDGTTLIAKINGTLLEATVPASNIGDVGPVVFKAYTLGSGNAVVTINKVSLVDLDLSRVNPLSYPPRFIVDVNGLGDSRSIDMPLDAYGPFNTNVELSSEDNPLVDGNVYLLSVLVRDLSQRESAQTIKTIKYSTRGPQIDNITFVPELSVSSQRDRTYIEYGYNATVKVGATSAYDLVSATVQALPSIMEPLEPQEINTLVAKYGLSGLYDTLGLPTGLLDVKVTVTDANGVDTSRIFENALMVRNLKNPSMLIDVGDNLTTNGQSVILRFNVSDTKDTNCTITYYNATGGRQVDAFLASVDLAKPNELVVALSQPLASASGEMVESKTSIACHSNTITRNVWPPKEFPIFVDKRAPIFSASVLLTDKVILDSYDRVVKSYVSYTSGLRTIHIDADEPVVCRLKQVTSKVQPEDSAVYYDAMGSSSEILVGLEQVRRAQSSIETTIDGVDASNVIYAISCADAGGSVAKEVRFIELNTNTNAAPYIIEVSPTVVTTSSRSQVFTVTTATPAVCTIKQPSQSATNMDVIVADNSGTSERSYSKQLSFANDATYVLTVSCANGNGAARTKDISIVVDTVLPTISVTPSLEVIEDTPSVIYTQSPTISLNVDASESVNLRIASADGSNVIYAKTISDAAQILDVAVPIGVTDVVVSASDVAGNIVSYPTQIRRAALGYASEFVDLLPNSIRPRLNVAATDNVAYAIVSGLTLTDAITASAQLFKTNVTSSPTVVTTSLNPVATGTLLKFTIPSGAQAPLSDGEYMLTYVVKSGDIVIAANSAVFTIDSLSELIASREQFAVNRRNVASVNVNLSVPYRNLISGEMSSWNGVADSLKRVYNLTTQRNSLAVSSGSSTSLAYQVTNEIGHTSKIMANVVHDINGPTSPVTFALETRDATASGTIPTSDSPVPLITLYYNAEPLRLISAQFAKGTTKFDVVTIGVQDQQFYNSIQLTSARILTNGNYDLLVTLADKYGNVVTSKYQFKIAAASLKITLVEPVFMTTSIASMPIVVATNRPALCKYAPVQSVTSPTPFDDMSSFVDTTGTTHGATLSFTDSLAKYTVNYNVSCVDEGTITPIISKIFALGKNTIKPKITSLVVPASSRDIVANPDFANLEVVTDAPTICRYTDVTSSVVPYAQMTPFENSSSLSLKNVESLADILVQDVEYNFTVVCDNGAGVQSDRASVKFKVDVNRRDLIDITSPSVEGYYQNAIVPIKFNLAYPAVQGCVYATSPEALLSEPQSISPTPSNNLAYSLTPTASNSPFVVGSNTLYVLCKFIDADGNPKAITATRDFVIDTTEPIKGYVSITGISKSENNLDVEFVFSDPESGIAQYQYAVGTSPYGKSGWDSVNAINVTSENRLTISGLDFVAGQAYYVSAIAKNNAGRSSTPWISSNATFVVDRNLKYLVDVSSPQDDGMYQTTTVPIQFTLPYPATKGCVYSTSEEGLSESPVSISPKTSSGLIYGITPSSSLFEQGTNHLYVKCTFAIGSEADTVEIVPIQFVVDNTPPANGRVRLKQISQVDGAVGVDVELLFSDSESNISSYEYAIGTKRAGQIGWNDTKATTQWLHSDGNVTIRGVTFAEGKVYYVSALAKNGAGRSSALVSSNAFIVINNELLSLISITSPRDNSKYASASNLPVQFSLSYPAQNCIYALSQNELEESPRTITATAGDELKYSATPSSSIFVQGRNKLFVQCSFANGDEAATIESAQSEFTIDTTAPESGQVRLTNISKGDGSIDVEFVFRDNESGVSSYEYAVGTKRASQTGWDSTKAVASTNSNKVTISALSLVPGQIYYVSALAKNGVGLDSQRVSSHAFTLIDGVTQQLITVTSPKDSEMYLSATGLPIQFSLAYPATGGCVYAISQGELAESPKSISPTVTNPARYNVTPVPTPFVQGRNEFLVQCTFTNGDEDSNSEVSSNSFIVDQTAPIEGRVKLLNISKNDGSLDVEFVFKDDESGVSSYEYAVGTKPAGQVGWNNTLANTRTNSNRVTVSGLELLDGQIYYVSALAKNGVGRQSPYVSSNALVVVNRPPENLISITSPRDGSTYSSATLPVQFSVSYPALQGCIYSTTQEGLTESPKTISATAASNLKYSGTPAAASFRPGVNELYVQCTFVVGDEAPQVKRSVSQFIVDTTAPENGAIRILDFDSVKDSIEVEFIFRDNESNISYYEYAVGTNKVRGQTGWNDTKSLSRTTSDHVTISGLDLIDGQSYYVSAYAQNAAGKNSTWATSNALFAINGSLKSLIQITSPKYEGYYQSVSIPIQFTVAYPAQSCIYATTLAGLNSSTTARTITAGLSNPLSYNSTPTSSPFKLGNNELYVRCTFATNTGGLINETEKIPFIADSSAPDHGYVVIAPVTTKRDRISANLVFKDNESGIAYYEYVVGTEQSGTIGWNNTKNISKTTTGKVTITGLKLLDGETYYVSATAYNRAGKQSSWVSSNSTHFDINGDSVDEDNVINPGTVSVDLTVGTIITYANNTRLTLKSSTKISVPSTISSQFKPGFPVILPTQTTMVVDGKVLTIPARSQITLPAKIDGLEVVEPPGQAGPIDDKKDKDNGTLKNPPKKPVVPKPQPAPETSGFGAALLLFLLTLGLVGGGVGYFFYARKQQGRATSSSATGGYGSSNSSYSDVVVPSGPLTVNDKLKLALQSRIRKQKGTELPGKTSQLFSAFGNDAGTKASQSFTARIGVTKDALSGIPKVSTSASSTYSAVASPTTSMASGTASRPTSSFATNDIDQTLRRTQLSLDKLKNIASKQKPTGQLRRLQSKAAPQAGSALSRLRSLRKN